MYDLAPRPSISRISVSNGLSANLPGDIPMNVPIDTDEGFKLFKLLYQGGFAAFDGDKVKIIGGHVPYYVKVSLLPNFTGFEMMMGNTSFGLSEAGEIKIQQIITNMFPSFRSDPQNQISIMMNGLDVGSFYIKVAEDKGFRDTTRMTCRDLIDHMLTITAIEFHIDGFGDRLVALNNLNIPLDTKLYDARQTLHNAITDRSYNLFELFRKELLSLPDLTEDNKQAINSIENPYLP